MTISLVTDRFEQYLATERRYSLHTLTAYLKDLGQFFTFAEITNGESLGEVDHRLIRGWMVSMLEQQLTARSVSRKLSCLRSFFSWCRQEGLISDNPMLKVRAPKIEKRLPQFVKEREFEVERIEPLFGNDIDGIRDRLMLELFYQTGIRLSELLNLQEKDVSSAQIKVLGKRNKERIIPIGNQLFELVCLYQNLKPSGPDSDAFLFVKKDGRKVSSKFVYRKINTYLGSVTNVQKKSPHVLRHTFATHMLNHGAGLETLKELLGHASLSATQVYTHNSFAQINAIYSQAHPRGHKK